MKKILISLLLSYLTVWANAVVAQSQPDPAKDEPVAQLPKEIDPGISDAADGLTKFEPPVRVTFEGRPIEVESPGYACPTMVDFAGQGVFDLVVGQFAYGNMQHFRNASAAGVPPNFSNRQWLMSKNLRATIPGVRCCTSSTPQFVDWNGDGRLDVLSGCYATPGFPAGHIVLLLGEPDFQFSLPVYLTGSRGERLQNADYRVPGNDAQRLKDSICTHQHAVDLDQDGDLDLVVGASSGSFFQYENIGTAKQPDLKQPPAKLSIASPVGRSAPHCVDWNGDGKIDLLTGGIDGGVYLSLNRGSATKTNWEKFETLIEPSRLPIQIANDAIRPGHSSRIWAFDWNGDNKLDLLVGDCVSLLSPMEGIAEARFGQLFSELKTKKGAVEAIRAELFRIAAADKSDSDPASSQRVELEKKLERAIAELNPLESVRHLWAKESKTGFVWLFLQK